MLCCTFFLVNMPNDKLKTTRCAHQQSAFSPEEGQHVEPNGGHVRLAIGKEVEVAQNADCFRKTPSLDDVLDQLQGDCVCRSNFVVIQGMSTAT